MLTLPNIKLYPTKKFFCTFTDSNFFFMINLTSFLLNFNKAIFFLLLIMLKYIYIIIH